MINCGESKTGWTLLKIIIGHSRQLFRKEMVSSQFYSFSYPISIPASYFPLPFLFRGGQQHHSCFHPSLSYFALEESIDETRPPTLYLDGSTGRGRSMKNLTPLTRMGSGTAEFSNASAIRSPYFPAIVPFNRREITAEYNPRRLLPSFFFPKKIVLLQTGCSSLVESRRWGCSPFD